MNPCCALKGFSFFSCETTVLSVVPVRYVVLSGAFLLDVPRAPEHAEKAGACVNRPTAHPVPRLRVAPPFSF